MPDMDYFNLVDQADVVNYDDHNDMDINYGIGKNVVGNIVRNDNLQVEINLQIYRSMDMEIGEVTRYLVEEIKVICIRNFNHCYVCDVHVINDRVLAMVYFLSNLDYYGCYHIKLLNGVISNAKVYSKIRSSYFMDYHGVIVNVSYYAIYYKLIQDSNSFYQRGMQVSYTAFSISTTRWRKKTLFINFYRKESYCITGCYRRTYCYCASERLFTTML